MKMNENLMIEKLKRDYTNLVAELEIAYEHGLSYDIVNSMHYAMYNLKKTLYKHQVNPDS